MQRRLVQNFTYILEWGQGTCSLMKHIRRCWAYSRYFFPACCLLRFAAFLEYKKILHQKNGVIGIDRGLFLGGPPSLRGQRGGTLYKNSNVLGQIFSQRIDSKSQKMSATFAWPFGLEKCTKKVRVNLTPPPPHGRKG